MALPDMLVQRLRAVAESELAAAAGATIIVAVTGSGTTARRIAALRPPLPVYGVTADDAVARQLALYRSVVPLVVAADRLAVGQLKPELARRGIVRAGDAGLTVGEIQERSGLPASTLAHHLRVLAAGGLVAQERKGRAVVSRAAYRQLEALAAFLLDECCVDARPSHQARAALVALTGDPA